MKQILLVFAFLVFPFLGQSQPIVGDVLEKGQRIFSREIENATISADYLLNKTLEELKVLLETGRLMLNNDLNKRMSKLDGDKYLLISKIQEFTDKIESGKSEFVSITDNLILDVNAIVGRTSFAKEDFIIKRISNNKFIYNEIKPYRLKITATNIGLPSYSTKTKITSIALEGRRISDYRVIPAGDHNEAFIEFSKKDLNKLFKSKEITYAEVKMNVLFQRQGRFKKDRAIDYTIYIKLIPKYAGELTVNYSLPVYNWVKIDKKQTTKHVGHSHHCKKNCGGHPDRVPHHKIDFSVPSSNASSPKENDKKLENPQARCISGPCGYTHTYYTRLENNKTKAVAEYKYWSHPVTYELTADVYEYRKVSETKKKIKNELEFGELIVLKVPDDAERAIIKGVLTTGDKISLTLGSSNKFLRLEDTKEPFNRNYKEYYYRVIQF